MRTKHHFSNNAKRCIQLPREAKAVPLILPAVWSALLVVKPPARPALALMWGLKSKISSRIFYHASLAELADRCPRAGQRPITVARATGVYPDNFPLAMLYAQALIADEQYISAESVPNPNRNCAHKIRMCGFVGRQPVLQVMSRVCIWPERSTFARCITSRHSASGICSATAQI